MNPVDSASLRQLLAGVRVLPVVTVEQAELAVPVAGALAEGGLATIEITLRTPQALRAIELVNRQLPHVTVGAGTLMRAEQFGPTVDAGAHFAVSPGLTGDLVWASRRAGLPLLPGVATASEAMVALGAGFDFLKLFPARQAGGPALLRAFAGPLSELIFCPTGGIDAETYREYLSLANVHCVGGSWMVPRGAVEAGDWGAITSSARAVCEQVGLEECSL